MKHIGILLLLITIVNFLCLLPECKENIFSDDIKIKDEIAPTALAIIFFIFGELIYWIFVIFLI